MKLDKNYFKALIITTNIVLLIIVGTLLYSLEIFSFKWFIGGLLLACGYHYIFYINYLYFKLKSK